MRDSDKSLKTKFTDYEVYTFGYSGQKKKSLDSMQSLVSNLANVIWGGLSSINKRINGFLPSHCIKLCC